MIEIFEDDKGKWAIRKGLFVANCVVGNLSERDLKTIHDRIEKILKLRGFKLVRETKNEKEVRQGTRLITNKE